jgi:hypothetical protein
MPKFMDFHADLKLPPEAIRQFAETVRRGQYNEFGVRVLDVYHNAEGKVYCFLEAPDAEAVRQHHASLGVPCGEVHEVKSLAS